MHGIDEFHLLSGIGVFLIELLTVNSSKNVKNNSCFKYLYQPTKEELDEHQLNDPKDWPYPFSISAANLNEITELVEKSRSTVPTTSFESTWSDPISGKSHGYRGVEWIEALLFMVPTLFVPRLRYKRASKPILALCKAASLMLQWCITSEDLKIIKRLDL